MTKIAPENVISTIREHLIGDGFEFVLNLEKSHGSRIIDSITGRELIDFYSCFASNPVGFNHPKMEDKETLKRLTATAVHNVTNSDLFTTYKAEFVKTWFDLAAPSDMKYMFCIAGGSMAIENALKAAFDWKFQLNRQNGDTFGRGTQVLHLRKAFHGRSGYTMSLTNSHPDKTERFPKFNWPRIDNPSIVFPDKGENKENRKDREKKAIKQAKHAILEHGIDIAACILEPIQGEGGDNHFSKEFLLELQGLCNDNDIMFIVDEVQSGMGLTGKMWAFEHFDLKPDMVVFGKKAQVCGFMSTAKIDRIEKHVFNTSSRINSTWGGNLVDMVRCQRYLEIMKEDDLVGNAARMGEVLLEGLLHLQDKYSTKISNARGRGLMCAFDMPSAGERDSLRGKLYDAGLLVLSSGVKSIRFRPTLTVTREDLSQGLAIIDKTLAASR